MGVDMFKNKNSFKGYSSRQLTDKLMKRYMLLLVLLYVLCLNASIYTG